MSMLEDYVNPFSIHYQ